MRQRSHASADAPVFHRCQRKIWTLSMVAVCLMFIIGFEFIADQDMLDISHYSYILNQNSTEADFCKIPVLEPWDATIRQYIRNSPPLECRQVQAPLTFLHNQRLFLNKTAFDEAGYSLDLVQCQRRCFDRGRDDDHNVYGEWQIAKNNTQIECEFVEVECRRRLLSVYSELHAQIKPILRAAIQTKRFGVTLFVLDSVSQSHWRRSLPRTLNTLQKLYNSTILTGFNKVADNSFPNAIAFLAGLRNVDDRLPAEASDSKYDNWPLIWKDFQNQGYATFYAEDYPKFNLFNYLSNGFTEKPVDHHFRPYWLELYNSFVYRRSKYLCYNKRPMHMIQMAYYRDLVRSYHRKRPFFALHWLTELAHDWLSQVSSADQDIELFLKEEEERLQDTFLFMFSDHGHRFDPIRQTMIGRLEERMPFFSMHVPQQIYMHFPKLLEILEWNSKQLASFFDLYVTLRDILDLQERDAWSELRQRNQPIERFRRFSAYGLSLLRPLPTKRTCEEAGIPEEYCICQTEQIVNISEPIVKRAASYIVQHTNQILEPFRNQCALLKLKRVIDARMSMPNKKVINGHQSRQSRFFPIRSYDSGVPKGVYLNYALMLEVEPNGAVLEATARQYFVDNSLRVVGDVNRLNRYGNQSACIRNAVARKYCYCI